MKTPCLAHLCLLRTWHIVGAFTFASACPGGLRQACRLFKPQFLHLQNEDEDVSSKGLLRTRRQHQGHTGAHSRAAERMASESVLSAMAQARLAAL